MGLFENIWKGIRRMFGYTTLKTIVGKDVALSSRMIDAINDWKSMLTGNAEWLTDSIQSLRIEQGICREFADIPSTRSDVIRFTKNTLMVHA